MKTVVALAIAHPFLALVTVWGVNYAVRQGIKGATGYDTLAIMVDALKVQSKAREAKAKATP